MAYSVEQWDVVRAFYEAGLSLAEIVDRDEVEITSRSQISKKAKSDGWIKSDEKKQLIARAIRTKQEVVAIKEEKETLKETDRIVHDTIVDERTKDLMFFRNASLIVAQKAVQKVQTEECSMGDLRQAQELIGKGKENIFGKQIETAIQINNSQPEPYKVEFITVDASEDRPK